VCERRKSGEDLSQLTVGMDGQGSAKEDAEEKRDGILRGCGSFLACVRMSCSGDALGFVGWHHAYGGNG